MKLLFSLFIVFVTVTGFSQNRENFDLGNVAYDSSDFETALAQYETLINNNDVSFELFFNASNSAFKLNQVGKACFGEIPLRRNETQYSPHFC